MFDSHPYYLIMFQIDKLSKDILTEDTNEFRDALINKSVALVGPARYILGINQGDFIDSHDIVVRINNVFEAPSLFDLYKEYIGSRTDYLYTHPLEMNKWEQPVPDGIKIRSLGSLKLFGQLNNFLGGKPGTCGIKAIYELCVYPCTSLYVTGFSFFQHYSSGNDNIFRYRQQVQHPMMRAHHNYAGEFNAFKILCDQCPKISYDYILAELIKNSRAVDIPD